MLWSHLFGENVVLTLSQKERRQNDPKREKDEKEARELQKELEVVVIPVSSDQNAVRTPSQRGKRREELKCGKKEKEVKEAVEKAKEALDGEVHKPTERATALPDRTGVILSPPPTTQGPLPEENVPPVAGPSGRIAVGKSPPLPTLSPAEMFHNAGRLDPRDRKSTRLNSSHFQVSRMPSSA